MRAVQVWHFGGPEELVLGEVNTPVASPGEVLVDVAVAGMTFVETQIRRGTDPWHAPPELPYIPGAMVAGRVSSLGAGVESAWLGTRVVASTGDTGAFAEIASARVEDLFTVPTGLGLAEAVALCSDGITALGLVEGAAVQKGDWVLVEAAAGGVGSLVIQLARAAGAFVIGAARGGSKLEVLRELGVDLAVDYSEDDWASRVLDATGGAGVNVVFDGVGGAVGTAAFGTTARGARFSVHGASSGAVTAVDPQAAMDRGVEVIGIEQLFGFEANSTRWAEQVMSTAVAGHIRPLIGQTFPLERAAEAHAAVENRMTVGKTLIVV